jgi:ABC-type multidrug transport system ATPase subunit
VAKPVLEAARVRVDVDGVPQLDGLSFETTGDRVLVLAGPTALFGASAGMLEPRHGELLTGGLSPRVAMRQNAMAVAPLDPPLPPSWTARQYVVWSSRLAGHARPDADRHAADSLAKLKLDALADARLRRAPLHVRRALTVAAALATGATTLFFEDPLRGLTEDVARAFARVLLRGTSGLRTVIFAARASLASPLAIDADEVLVVDGSRVVAQGAPAEVAGRERSYTLRLHGRGASFARVAEQRGARVSGHGAHWTIDLGESLETSDILDVAAASDTVILELRPLAHAFA